MAGTTSGERPMLSPCWACCIQAWQLSEATPPLQHPGELLQLPSVPAALLSPCSTAPAPAPAGRHQPRFCCSSKHQGSTRRGPTATCYSLLLSAPGKTRALAKCLPGSRSPAQGNPPTRDPRTPSLCMALLLPSHSKHGGHRSPTSSPKELPQIQGSGAAAQVGHEERRELAALVP